MNKLPQDVLGNIFNNLDTCEDILNLCETDKELNSSCNQPIVRNIIINKFKSIVAELLKIMVEDIETHEDMEASGLRYGQQGEHYFYVAEFAYQYMDEVNKLMVDINEDTSLTNLKEICGKITRLKSERRKIELRAMGLY